MGIKQSVYEKSGTLDYYKFSAKEYALVKKVWSGIELNPQFHGDACLRSFCETHPQYVKFFTQESKLHLNFDTRITTKFSIIMETLGYLLLDFNKKPKQLDRLVGYIAMVHKDMQLDEQDMHNLVTSLFEYLSRTYPTQMTAQCQEAMSKFMDSVIKELLIKMKTFCDYEVVQSEIATRSKPPLRRCPFFAEPLIFGKTKLYWDDWKKQWNARLDEWAMQAAFVAQESTESILFTNENHTLALKRNDIDEEDEKERKRETVSILQRRTSVLRRKRQDSDVASRLALLSLSKTFAAERSLNQTQRQTDKQRHEQHISVRFPNEHPDNGSASRKRYRAKVLRDVSKINETKASIDRPALDKTISEDRRNDKVIIEQQKCESSKIVAVKAYNIARERRRKRFNVDLKYRNKEKR